MQRRKKKSEASQKGQVVLLFILITVLGLTVGLSLISRTVTDVRISSQVEQSGRAFSAAEAGIETGLQEVVSGSVVNGSIDLGEATANYTVEPEGGSLQILTLPLKQIGESQSVWLIEHNPDGTINETGYSYPPAAALEVCWGSVQNTTPAVELSLFYLEAAEYKIANAAFDPDTGRGNGFQPADSGGGYCDGNFLYRKILSFPSDFGIPVGVTLYLMRVTPVYDQTELAFRPSAALPVQGKRITSVGQTETGIARKIQVQQGYAVLPALFDFGLFVEN